MKKIAVWFLIVCLCGGVLFSCGYNTPENNDPNPASGESSGDGTETDSGSSENPQKPDDETTGGNPSGPAAPAEGFGETVDWGEGGTNYDLTKEVRFFGRTYVRDGAYYMNWSASGFEFSFRGSGAKANLISGSIKTNYEAYVKVTVDGTPTKRIPLMDATQDVVLAAGLDPDKTHTVRVEMISGNGKCATAALRRLTLTDGQKLPAPSAPDGLKMEIIGDSISIGYGLWGTSADKDWKSAQDDATLTAPALAARALGMEYHVTASSGKGMVKDNAGNTGTSIPNIYQKVDGYHNGGQAWDFSWQPDVIVINLGTNDASAGVSQADFKKGCANFLKTLREKNPNAYIIYLYGAMGTTYKATIQDVISEMNDSKVSFMDWSGLTAADKTVHSHPSLDANKKCAEKLIEKLQEIFGANATVKTPITDIIAADQAATVDESLVVGLSATDSRKFSV